MGKMLNILFPCYFLILCFILFHLYTLLLFFCAFNLPPQFPIPLISLQVPVSGRAKGVISRSFSVPLPVAPGLRFPDGRGTGADGFFHVFPAVAVGAHPQSNHGVHAGIVFNAQIPADILQMGIIGRGRIAGPKIRHWERPALGLSFLGFLRVLMVNPSGQSQRLAALPALCKHARKPAFPDSLRGPGRLPLNFEGP